MKIKVPAWGQFLPVVKLTFWRFPLPFVSTVLTTLLTLLLILDIDSVDDDLIGKGIAATIYSTVSLASLKLLAESASWHIRRYLVVVTIVLVVIANYVWEFLSETTSTTHIFFALAIALSLIFAPYLGRQSNQASVWYFNYQTGVALFFGGLAALLLGISLSLSLVSIDYLFEIKIPEELYGDVWTISWGLLFPIYVLANLPREFDFADENCVFPRGIRFIANYILAPMMLAYMAILYAYFVKIIVQWELPRGNLGWMITTFGSIGIITKLLAYPIRSDGKRLLILFDRYYYHALIVPIILLAIAIGVRINDYGFTEQRYAVVLLGIWFFTVAMMTILKKDQFHIKLIPIILALLASMASFGPWGAVEVSVNSQVSRFENALTMHGLLVDGVAIKASSPVSFEDRKSISSIADYLGKSDYRMERIYPWFRELIASSDLKKFNSGARARSRELVELLGLEYVRSWQKLPTEDQFSYNNNFDLKKTPVMVSGFDYFGRSGYSSNNKNSFEKKIEIDHDGKLKTISISRQKGLITISVDSGYKIAFDLEALVLKIKANGASPSQLNFKNNSILTHASSDNEVRVRILLEQIHGKIKDDGVPDITHVHFYYLVDFNN